MQWLTVLVPAVCAGLYETVRHSLLATELPNVVGTLVAVALVLGISSVFARVAFGMIRQTEARLRERNRQLQALSRRVERLAVAEERDRLAREMHDSVAQVLAYLLVSLDTVEGLLERGRSAEAAREVARLRASGQEAYADVREAIAGLRTRPQAGASGLAAALAVYVREFGDRADVEATFTAGGLDAASGDDLTPAAEMQLLRIAQEALANVRKHARATRVTVQLRRTSSAWELVVHDDGAGFSPDAIQSTLQARMHVGLAIMRERAEGMGGALDVASTPGSGTTITVRLPFGAGAATPRDGSEYPNIVITPWSDLEPAERGATAPALG